mmetsp:Transcript_7543/g.21024  ORF Transcript_7543/g.21024 Transcript_7543/m.21024 type:complete len:232 (-) Transcript_7543:362-1057(-)|eukprot:CAMPEP_0181030218 /NCGR_PEP_ID=MMETSP1070-20121207/5608_1 /TAXON_ID=265543 /ORGANISM="Minutocellus polymorphus, Strain NH13" /LENGTH=231 /DNA_ID=CAMNT_0023107567 /DNA_START=1491 /DNA_END=2186 /DNA_ORIENTATION=-
MLLLSNEDMLYLISTGTARLEKYWVEYYLEGDLNQYQRLHSKVDLRKVPALQNEKAEADKKLRVWATSTVPAELEEFRKDDLIHNQKWMNCLLPDNLKGKLPAKSASRKVHSQKLAGLRIQYKNYQHSDEGGGIEESTEINFLDEDEEHEAGVKSMSLKEELSLPFYKMTEVSKSKFITKNYRVYDNILGPFNTDVIVGDTCSSPQQQEDSKGSIVAESQQSQFSLGFGSQ